MPDLNQDIVTLLRTSGGYHRSEEPFTLASGQLSHDYVDGKLAVARGADLRLVSEAVIAAAGQPFDAVGGLTMGADALAHGVALVADCLWFSVRKEPKARGLNRFIEGARLEPGHRVVLVDDVVTTGGSIFQAYDKVREETGAVVVAVVTLVDRGDVARRHFEALGVQFHALVTYTDLGIEPVGPALSSSPR